LTEAANLIDRPDDASSARPVLACRHADRQIPRPSPASGPVPGGRCP